ncbi:unnamed protein product [Lactuca saligna]|uniref:S-protein homolog n=1 Tax=Lactuca saligna TaxID=75948 RepID=A0AA35ZQ03_LACSI|nr:unnamed protein product [Lactuca saligna]
MKAFFAFLFVIVIISRSVLGIHLDPNFQTNTRKQYKISINDVGLWALGFECQINGGQTVSRLINPGDESLFEFHAGDGDATFVPCDFYWGKKDRNIHVYDDSLKKQCGDNLVNTCKWKISSDGFYVYDISQNPPTFVKMNDW